MGNDNIEGRWVSLSPFLKNETSLLLKLRNSECYRYFCSTRRNIITLEEFDAELKYDFNHDRHLQFIIRKKSDNKLVGTIFSYNFNKADGNVFVTTYITEDEEKSYYGVEAHALFIEYLFRIHNIHKIYADVYSINKHSLSVLLRAGYVIEGKFKEHRLLPNETRCELIRMAFYRDNLSKLDFFLEKLGSKKA